MNQIVLLLIAVALVSGAFGLRGDETTPNVVWMIFFASVAGAVYFYWKNRGETKSLSGDQHSGSESRGAGQSQSPRM